MLDENSKFGKNVSERSIINSVIPLIETVGYSTFLRSISKVIKSKFVFQFKKIFKKNIFIDMI